MNKISKKVEYREIDIPNLIRFIRKKEGLTQKEFGKLFGFAESATSMWENGKREAPYKVLEFVFSRWTDGLLHQLSKRTFNKKELEIIAYSVVSNSTTKEGGNLWKRLRSKFTDSYGDDNDELKMGANKLALKLSKLLKKKDEEEEEEANKG